MGQRFILNAVRHPAFALMGAALFGFAALAVVRAGTEAHVRTSEDDPVKISGQALDGVFDRDVADREIRAALASGDADLARSFVELAADRNVAIDPALADQVKAASANASSMTHTAGRFVRGLWTGEPEDMASLAGTAVGDLFVFGDIRDAAREGTRYLTGQQGDPWVLGLAGVGLAITVGTYVSAGSATPARVGLSVVKAARRPGRLTARMTGWIGHSLREVVDWGALSRVSFSQPALAVRMARDAVKVEEAGGLVDLVSDVGRVESKAGTQAALESLQVAEGPQDMSRLARLAAAKGGKTRAIVKLLGRAAIMLTMTALDFAMWLFWAAFMLFGFVSSLKAATERVTLRYIRWRKAGRVRQAELRLRPAIS